MNYYSLANNTKNNFIFRIVLFYEGLSHKDVYGFIIKAIQNDNNFCEINLEKIREILEKCNCVKKIIDTEIPVGKKIDELTKYVSISEKENLKVELERQPINQNKITKSERDEEVEAELEETELKKMCAVELMTIGGSKGLSADHVIIIGFDDVNMSWVTKNAFYVAMTRARKSLHILTALRSGGATRAHNFLNQLPESHAEFFSYKKNGHIKTALRGRQGFINYLNTINSASWRRR